MYRLNKNDIRFVVGRHPTKEGYEMIHAVLCMNLTGKRSLIRVPNDPMSGYGKGFGHRESFEIPLDITKEERRKAFEAVLDRFDKNFDLKTLAIRADLENCVEDLIPVTFKNSLTLEEVLDV